MTKILGLLVACAFAQQSSLPPGSPPGAYDPIVWGQLIDRNRPCQLRGPAPKDCSYTGTPLTGPVTWSCTAGSFCVAPGQIQACTPGFYCPVNTAMPVLCPEGFVCRNDTTQIEVCPAGQFCPVGTTVPKYCGVLAWCPEGSADAPKFVLLLAFGLVSVVIYFMYQWKGEADRIREIKRKIELRQAATLARMATKPVVDRLEKTFDIEFENLGLRLPNGVEIMKGVSGTLRSGRTCAIMGPSGSGKTTFVTLLTGKQPRTTGTVKINGVEDELSNYSKLIGYVPQEDIMLRELSVRDILMHSARMRLPSDWDYQRVKKKVNEIIDFLGMAHVAHSNIGDEEERGISGGQRKRVNIGMELVAEPSVLFLDEPTSGLDSSTAFDVCQNLRNIAIQQGLTVAAVIHSPSPTTFKQFDDFILLGKGGRIVYIGPRDQALDYFKRIGFTCPADESPSDFFMDVVSGFVASEYDTEFKPTDLADYWQNRHLHIFAHKRRMTPEQAEYFKKQRIQSDNEEQKFLPPPKVKDYYAFTDYIASGLAAIIQNVSGYLKGLFLEFFEFLKIVAFMVVCKPDPVRETAPAYMKAWFLMRRAAHQVYRTPQATLVDLGLNFTAGLFISIAVQEFGFVGGQPPEVCSFVPSNLQYLCVQPTDRLREAGMFICLGVLFSGISVAGNTFGKEKVVYWRDTAAGMPVFPYFVAKVLVDVPRIILGGTMFSVALVMFFPYAQSFVSLYLIVICLHFYAFALGYALSTAVSYAKMSLYGTGFSLLWALVLSGVMPSLHDVLPREPWSDGYPPAIRWLWTVAAPRWAIEAFYIAEVKALPFVEKTRDAAHMYNYNNLWLDIRMIWIITLSWLGLALLGLKLFNRSKQK